MPSRTGPSFTVSGWLMRSTAAFRHQCRCGLWVVAFRSTDGLSPSRGGGRESPAYTRRRMAVDVRVTGAVALLTLVFAVALPAAGADVQWAPLAPLPLAGPVFSVTNDPGGAGHRLRRYHGQRTDCGPTMARAGTTSAVQASPRTSGGWPSTRQTGPRAAPRSMSEAPAAASSRASTAPRRGSP